MIRFRMRLQRLIGELLGRLPNSVGPTFWAFRPDSHWIFRDHEEFRYLLPRWIAHNPRNAGDITRLYSLVLNLKRVLADSVPGDFAELGVYRGNSASVLSHFAAQNNRLVYLFDTFSGFDSSDLVGVDSSQPKHFFKTSVDMVRSVVRHDDHCRYIEGLFPASITEEAKASSFAFVSLDCDLYRPTRDGLEFFSPRMSQGGMIFVHDYSSGHWPGATKAVDEFCSTTGRYPVLLPDKAGTAVFIY